jgi:cold shock CspA family protein
MSRPQETFNKRELEKIRLQKRKEKEQRKGQRKADAKDGKSFEDMLAYVDEYGNITDTPPDPTRKKKINENDVSLESRNKGGSLSLHERRSGKVTFFNQSKGFGFIQDEESKENIFVHTKSFDGMLNENDQVTFEVGKSFKGLVALNVKMK